jgi:16S rRNA (uracil1498-N3)-methyltransferase
MSERFFVPTPITGLTASLSGEEARHLAAVMRAKTGDRVVLFDGGGAEFEAEIDSIRKHTIELTIVGRRELSRELSFELTLAVALPKGERQKWLVEKATELGVSRVVPLLAERGVAQPVEAALERLRKTVIEASKQCGRNRLLEIAAPEPALAFLARQHSEHACWIGDAEGGRPCLELHESASGVTAAIGPEGGFSPAEQLAAQDAGWQRVSLGRRILRVETAAIAAAATAAALWPNS